MAIQALAKPVNFANSILFSCSETQIAWIQMHKFENNPSIRTDLLPLFFSFRASHLEIWLPKAGSQNGWKVSALAGKLMETSWNIASLPRSSSSTGEAEDQSMESQHKTLNRKVQSLPAPQSQNYAHKLKWKGVDEPNMAEMNTADHANIHIFHSLAMNFLSALPPPPRELDGISLPTGTVNGGAIPYAAVEGNYEGRKHIGAP